MANNNYILFTFGLIFLLLGFFQPIIKSEFIESYDTYNNEVIVDPSQENISLTGAIEPLVAIFFWVVGAPAWLNLIFLMMRIIFWIIIYDKFRGISG